MAALVNEYTDYIILCDIDTWMNIYFVSGTVLGVGNTELTESSSLSLRCLDWHTCIECCGRAMMAHAQGIMGALSGARDEGRLPSSTT